METIWSAAWLKLRHWLKPVGYMMGGTILAQTVSLLAAPLLARLYGPIAYGQYGVFLAATAMLASISSGRLELAVSLPASERAAHQIAAAARKASLLVAMVCTLIVLAAMLAQAAFGGAWMAKWILAVPAAAVIVSWNGVFAQENLRALQFRRQSSIRVGQASANALSGICLGVLGLQKIGLISSIYLSQLFVLVMHMRRASRLTCSAKRMRAVLSKYREFPRKQIPVTIVETGSGYLPLFFIAPHFGGETAGYFFLAQSILRLPVQFLSTAVGEVFRQWLSRKYQSRQPARRGILFVLLALSLASIALFLPVPFLAPHIVPWIFGDQWLGAAPYLSLFAAICAAQFIASPISVVFFITGRHGLDLAVQSATFLSVAAVLGVAFAINAGPVATISAFAVVYVIRYMIQTAIAVRTTRCI